MCYLSFRSAMYTPRTRSASHVPSAFTLIELLVVLSIIALLIALLLPALQTARTAAHKAVSLSDVRQLTIAVHTYANNNESSVTWTAFDYGSGFGGGTPTWAGYLYHHNFVDSLDIFWSPARDTSALPMGIDRWDRSSLWWYTGYGMNEGVAPERGSGLTPMRLEERGGTPPTAECMLLLDNWNTKFDTDKGPHGFYAANPSHSGPRTRGAFTYNGDATRSYLDGHATGGDSEQVGVRNSEGMGRLADYWTYNSQTTGGPNDMGYVGVTPWFWDWRDNYPR